MRPAIQRFIDERVVVTVIVINTVTIFLRAFPWWRDQAESVLFAVDYICSLYFFAEIGLKVWHFGPRKYFSSGWNWFDAAVVLGGLPLIVAPFLPVKDVSFILILRVGRVARVFRLLRWVPDADRLWAGIRRGLKASIGVLLALALYNFVLALCACHLFGDVAPSHFGDPMISLYSMFKVITVEGWFDVPDEIAAGSSALIGNVARVFFTFAVATGGLLGLSLANAVLIDEMVMDNSEPMEDNIRSILAEVRALREQNEAMRVRLDEQISSLDASRGDGLTRS